MGLFKSKDQKMVERALKGAAASGAIKRKTITCPRCGKRYTVNFLGPNDSKTCTCGYKIYNN